MWDGSQDYVWVRTSPVVKVILYYHPPPQLCPPCIISSCLGSSIFEKKHFLTWLSGARILQEKNFFSFLLSSSITTAFKELSNQMQRNHVPILEGNGVWIFSPLCELPPPPCEFLLSSPMRLGLPQGQLIWLIWPHKYETKWGAEVRQSDFWKHPKEAKHWVSVPLLRNCV